MLSRVCYFITCWLTFRLPRCFSIIDSRTMHLLQKYLCKFFFGELVMKWRCYVEKCALLNLIAITKLSLEKAEAICFPSHRLSASPYPHYTWCDHLFLQSPKNMSSCSSLVLINGVRASFFVFISENIYPSTVWRRQCSISLGGSEARTVGVWVKGRWWVIM